MINLELLKKELIENKAVSPDAKFVGLALIAVAEQLDSIDDALRNTIGGTPR